MEKYTGKLNSDPHIVLVSTPKAPGRLMGFRLARGYEPLGLGEP
jgi:hypothetical protein